MNTGNLKNIVVLKDLPSNLVEEAIVVLKENQKIPKLEPASTDKKESNSEPQKIKNSKDYIIKEAQMLISEYISKIESKNKKENQEHRIIQNENVMEKNIVEYKKENIFKKFLNKILRFFSIMKGDKI